MTAIVVTTVDLTEGVLSYVEGPLSSTVITTFDLADGTLSFSEVTGVAIRVFEGGIGPQGPQGVPGVPGPTGPQGAPGAGYTFYQATPSDDWYIVHNLGFYPDVSITDSAGYQGWGDVVNVDSTRLHVLFASAFSGAAHLV